MIEEKEEISPCRGCENQEKNKFKLKDHPEADACAENCQRLAAYQLGKDFSRAAINIDHEVYSFMNDIQETLTPELLCSVCNKHKPKAKGMCSTCYARNWREKNNINYGKRKEVKMDKKAEIKELPKKSEENVFTVDLNGYPKILAKLRDIEGDGLLPIEHIIIDAIADSV